MSVAWPVRSQTYGYLPSCKSSPPIGWLDAVNLSQRTTYTSGRWPICWQPVPSANQASMSAVLVTGLPLCKDHITSLSLLSSLTAIFPGGPGLAGTRMSPFWILLELRMMEVVVITGAIIHAKSQSNCHQQTNTKPFYRPDAIPVAKPIMSKH